MSRPRFLADHDLNEHIIRGVLRREPVIEFVRARDLGLDALPDNEILEHAAIAGLLVVSHDANTMPATVHTRLSTGGSIPGLFMVRQSSPIGPIIESLVLIWRAQRTRGVDGPGRLPTAPMMEAEAAYVSIERV